MIMRLSIIFLSAGMLSVGGFSKSTNLVRAEEAKACSEEESVNIVDGVQYINFETPIVISPSP